MVNWEPLVQKISQTTGVYWCLGKFAWPLGKSRECPVQGLLPGSWLLHLFLVSPSSLFFKQTQQESLERLEVFILLILPVISVNSVLVWNALMLFVIFGSQYNGNRCKVVVFMNMNLWSSLPCMYVITKMAAKYYRDYLVNFQNISIFSSKLKCRCFLT